MKTLWQIVRGIVTVVCGGPVIVALHLGGMLVIIGGIGSFGWLLFHGGWKMIVVGVVAFFVGYLLLLLGTMLIGGLTIALALLIKTVSPMLVSKIMHSKNAQRGIAGLGASRLYVLYFIVGNVVIGGIASRQSEHQWLASMLWATLITIILINSTTWTLRRGEERGVFLAHGVAAALSVEGLLLAFTHSMTLAVAAGVVLCILSYVHDVVCVFPRLDELEQGADDPSPGRGV